MKPHKLIILTICVASVATSFAESSKKNFVAYSLNRAKAALGGIEREGGDFRKARPDIYYLGSITKPWAVVVDSENRDWILIGERDERSAILTLDDWVVALRARWIHNTHDPGVTIEPRVDGDSSGKQDVVFFGGIENTRFGRACFEADWLLKRIGLGQVKLPIPALRSYVDLAASAARAGVRSEVSSRFWYYPTLNRVNALNGVVLLERFQLGIFTEVLSARVNGEEVRDTGNFQFEPSAAFARSFEDNYEEIAEHHEVLNTLKGLTRLTGLAAGLVSQEPLDDLEFWLSEYSVEFDTTPTEADVLLERRPEYGLRVSGGVSLAALTVRLRQGDATALKTLVLVAHPEGAPIWEFEIELEDGRPAGIQIQDLGPDPTSIALLWTQAVFLYQKQHYEAAASLFSNVIELLPDWDYAYNARGAAFVGQGEFEAAIEDFDRAIELNPRLAMAFYNRAVASSKLQRIQDALRDYDRCLALNRNMIDAHLNRGLLFAESGKRERAYSDYSAALAIDPHFGPAYYNRGLLAAESHRYSEAIADFDKSLEFDPNLFQAYLARGVVVEELGEFRKAIQDYSLFLDFQQPSEDLPADWKDFAESRVRELLRQLALPPAYQQSHGGVDIAERSRRLRARLALISKTKDRP